MDRLWSVKTGKYTSMCSYVHLILALTLTWLSRGQANEGHDYPAFGQNAFKYRATPQNNYTSPTSQNRHSQPSQNISSQPSQDYRTGQPQTQRLAGQNGVKGTIGVPYWNAQPSESNGVITRGETSHEIGGQEVRPFVPYTIDNAAETKASEDYGTSQPPTVSLAGIDKTGQNHDQSNNYDNGTNNTIHIVPGVVMEEIGAQVVSVTYNTEDRPNPLLWHVGIYSKLFRPYMQICGGTLVTMDAVITAAHCFWSEVGGALPADQFAVGAGKRYRPWADTHDLYRQTSDVSAIHIPASFRGSLTSFQADIAVVRLTQKLVLSPAVRPACVSFDETLDNEQLAEGNLGTVLGWGLTQPDGRESPVLNYLELPVVPVGRCLDDSPADYLKYITVDKICAGVTTGKALCRGDSGGGLVFTDARATPPAPHLRAVASTAPSDNHKCNAHALATLTHTRAHRTFLRAHVPGLEQECRRHYHYPGVEQGSIQRIGKKLVCNCYCNSTRAK